MPRAVMPERGTNRRADLLTGSEMPPLPALHVALYVLVLDGVAALYLGELLGPLGVAAVVTALAGCWWHAGLRRRIDATSIVGRALVLIAAVGSAVDVLYLAPTALDGLVRLLLFLTLYRLLTLRSIHETRSVTFLAFFMLVAASSSAFGVGFLLVFVVFVVLVTWILLLQQVLSESEAGPDRVVVGADTGMRQGRPLLALALVASAGTAATTAALFFVIPRVGLAALPLRAAVGPMVTGFSERVELGAFGQIETDATVIMRVHIPDITLDPDRLPNLRWRGIVFDEFDGRAWTARDRQQTTLRRSGGTSFRVAMPHGTGPMITQEIFLEPIGTDVIFAAPRALSFRLRAETVQVDDMGSVSVATPLARLSYTVESELEPAVPRGRGASGSLEPGVRARFLQLPPIPARVAALARQVAADGRDPYDTARRLSHFLSREFRYTLALQRQTVLDPIEEFLFVRRSGNCEYFAASLAVMLRSLGIPARVVGGFQRGEWNPYGRYFMVRLSDAHSWVEAHVGGSGWVTLDPSPRGGAEVAPTGGELRLYLDALRMRWYRYVINWSLRDQVQAAATVRRQTLAWRAALHALGAGLDTRGAAVAVVALLAVVVAARRWRRPSVENPRSRARTLRFYERALRLVARRGLRPQPGETAREFCARVRLAAPTRAAPFARLTAAYERCRFGGEALTDRDEAELDACLRDLGRP